MAVDHDKELDLEDLELEEVASEKPRDGVLSEDDLEQYGVWVKVKPYAVSEKPGPVPAEPHLENLDQEPPATDEGLSEEEERLLGSLEERTEAPADLEDIGSLSIPEEEDLGGLAPEGEQVELPLTEEPGAERFEELATLRDEMGAVPAPATEQGPRTQILQKIEEELAAIRGELAALKSELVNLRRPGAGVEAGPAETEGEAGFFSDDSDETIALTGDELDNILNTAEITEEEAAEVPAGDEPAESPSTGRGEPHAAERFALDEPIEAGLQNEEASLELPEEAGPTEMLEAFEPGDESADSAEIELPDFEEIGLATPEGRAGETEAAEAEPEGQEPLEELAIELEEPAEDLQAAEEQEPEELALGPGGEDELVLDVPEEVSADLEPVEAEEITETALPAETDEEISLDVPELELSAEGAGEALEQELSLEIPEEEIAEVVGDSPVEAEILDLVEPAIEEAEALEAVELLAEEAAPLEDVEPAEEVHALEEVPAAESPVARPAERPTQASAGGGEAIPGGLKDEIRTVLRYMDQLLESLPDDKIEEFANSEYFEVYRRLFEELEIA